MDNQLQQSIEDLKEDFYASLSLGPTRFEAFAQSWAAFVQSLSSLTNKASASTMDRFQELSTAIATVTSGLLEYEEEKYRMKEAHNIANSNSSDIILSTLPRYLEPSWKWLCANLHNPYPAQAVREQIAADAKVPRRMVDSWFTDARKRIGWNDIRKNHFSNKQGIIDAATRFFVTCDDLDSALEGKFARMESTAKALYASKLVLDTSKKYRESRSSSSSPTAAERASSIDSPVSRHSKSLSRSRSPLSRKRSLSISSNEDRPQKRSRLERTTTLDNEQRLPTPPLSQGSWSSLASEDAPNPSGSRSPSPLSPTVSLPSKRKRRLSFCDEERRPKRPMQATSEPRRHAVSDPLPSSSTVPLESWCTNLFDDFDFELAGSCQMELPLDFPLDIQFANIAAQDVSFPALPTFETVPSLDDGCPSPSIIPSAEVNSDWHEGPVLDSSRAPICSSSSAPLVTSPNNVHLWEPTYASAPLSQSVLQPSSSISEQTWVVPQDLSNLLVTPTPHDFIYTQQPLNNCVFPAIDVPPSSGMHPSTQSPDKTEAIRQEVRDLRQKLMALEAQLAVSS